MQSLVLESQVTNQVVHLAQEREDSSVSFISDQLRRTVASASSFAYLGQKWRVAPTHLVGADLVSGEDVQAGRQACHTLLLTAKELYS